MSRIYFTSRDGEAELRGSERAMMGLLISRITAAIFDPYRLDRDVLLRLSGLADGSVDYESLGGGLAFARDFETLLAAASDRHFTVGDRRVSIFTACLNTVWLTGDDVLKLIARLHGQCEIHAWVDGPNRAWLADIIERGRARQILRPNQGWEAVAAFLRQHDGEPVVTSYSVTEGFPGRDVVRFDGDDDAWEALSHEARWDMGIAALRANEGPTFGLEMRPDAWDYENFYFGDGDTAFSLLADPTPAAPQGDAP